MEGANNSENSRLTNKDNTENCAAILTNDNDPKEDISIKGENNVNDAPDDKEEKTPTEKTSPSSESEYSGLNRTRIVSDSGHEGDISDVELSEDPFSSTERLFTKQHTMQSDLDDEDNQAQTSTCDGKDNDCDKKGKKS